MYLKMEKEGSWESGGPGRWSEAGNVAPLWTDFWKELRALLAHAVLLPLLLQVKEERGCYQTLQLFTTSCILLGMSPALIRADTALAHKASHWVSSISFSGTNPNLPCNGEGISAVGSHLCVRATLAALAHGSVPADWWAACVWAYPCWFKRNTNQKPALLFSPPCFNHLYALSRSSLTVL